MKPQYFHNTKERLNDIIHRDLNTSMKTSNATYEHETRNFFSQNLSLLKVLISTAIINRHHDEKLCKVSQDASMKPLTCKHITRTQLNSHVHKLILVTHRSEKNRSLNVCVSL